MTHGLYSLQSTELINAPFTSVLSVGIIIIKIILPLSQCVCKIAVFIFNAAISHQISRAIIKQFIAQGERNNGNETLFQLIANLYFNEHC